MDAMARARAIELLGRFNDDMTRAVDEVFGTHWAEIEEIIALALVASERAVTTRRIADVSGLGRRAVSRLILRLQAEGLVSTRPSDADKRAVEVVLTNRGEELSDRLRVAVTAFLRESRGIAREISAGLGGDAPLPPPGPPADALELLLRVCASGAALVSYMPPAATRGKLAARQRAALVMIGMGGGIRPTDLSQPLEVSPAGVVYIVDQLCAKGFVERRRGTVPGDGRAVVLEATPEGLRAIGAVMDGVEQERERLVGIFVDVAHGVPPARPHDASATHTRATT
ncbi:MarR family winged helix-turn-helix transcriptional regulator [Microbacterium sp. RURRCA19A]|uniref:MarR family winged helix-turn-helix transcriptional regulator n=1 Tax=Microbacterium sp. RURRCA19A TaxID=1907391 RepID=UPI0009574A53|nr:MarR family transcriptional regulator [Microbacterium sp. RURRCA19A]SIR91864.1 DNA-binding transcriptional regulator, MarR family [Microbacterium sp. RURRCA19A]